MGTSNSLVSDCCVTDALAEIGLNIREQTSDTTLDIDQDHINNFDLFCFPDKMYPDEQESGNGRNHVLEITENCAEYIQPIEKLRLFSVIPNEGNNVCGKAEMQAAWRPSHSVPSWKRGTSFISGNQNAGLPCSVNSTKKFIKKCFGIGNIATRVPLSMLTVELSGKQAIHMTRIRELALRVLQNNDFDNKDWVIAGVIVKEDRITSEAPVGNKTIRLEEKVPVRRNRNVSSSFSSGVLKKIYLNEKIEDKLPKIYKMRFKIVMCTDVELLCLEHLTVPAVTKQYHSIKVTVLLFLCANMATTSNNLVSDCCITDVLAEIGLNILEKNTDTTLDIEHDNNGILNLLCVSDKANACDTEEDIKPYSAPETSNISDVLERKSNAGEQKSINYSKHILEITENNTEYGQPVKKKLRLSNVTPNKKTSMCGKAESQETWCPPYVPSCTSKTSIFPRNQNTGLPFSVNSSEMFIEKHFGLGMRNTLVTLPTITEKMSGKQAIPMTRIRGFVNKILQNNDSENKDWVIAGVIVKKYITTSKAGKQYCSWTLSDLGERPLTVTVLLFASVFKALWKASLGTVVGILNPSAMETRSQHDGEATFTVRSADQIMLWGYSSDFGICEQKKKNGEKCGMFFNKRMYDCCIYHVVKTYKEFCGGRSELQKATGRNLRQTFSKKMGWSTPMGNRSTGFEEKVPVRRNQNLIQKDRNLLASLENVTETKEKCSDKVEMNATQTDLNFEIQPKTKLQEMLLLSRSNSSGIPNKVSDTVSVYHKNLRLGKNSKVTAEKETYCLKPSFTVTNPKNKTCNRTVNNKKERFEKLVLPTFFDSAGKKFQNAGNKGFNPKASIDKIMAAKRTNMFSETDFSLCIDNENSSMDKCNNKNNNNLMEYVANQNVSHQNKMAESVLEVCKAEAEYNTPELNEQNHCTDDESGSVSLITTNPVGQIKICKIVTKSDISAKSDHHKDREPSENENAKQLSDKLNRKKKTFTKNMCSQVNDEMQSKTFTGKLQSLKSPVAPDPQSSYGNRSRSMMEAIRYVREHGPIQKNRKSLEMKRLMSESGEESTAKEVDKFNGTTVISDKFTELMNTESTHTQLAESSAMEEYYNKMEQKEKIEEKLLNTYKVECKVVMCKVCKYKAGSASEFCKQNNHPLICVKGYRRFFGCSDCRKRIVIYDIFPRHNCVHCGSSSWIRVPVIEVKTTLADLNQLSLRGDELKFLNSCESNANINLLVPEG